MYNKNQYRKTNDKKILHKIGKRWMTVSIAMLALLGGSIAMKSVTTHADTIPSAKVNVQQQSSNKSNTMTQAKAVHDALIQNNAKQAMANKPQTTIGRSAQPSSVASSSANNNVKVSSATSNNQSVSSSANNSFKGSSVISKISNSVSTSTSSKAVTKPLSSSAVGSSRASSVNTAKASTVSNKASNNQPTSVSAPSAKASVASSSASVSSTKLSFNSAYQAYMAKMGNTDAQVAKNNASTENSYRPVRQLGTQHQTKQDTDTIIFQNKNENDEAEGSLAHVTGNDGSHINIPSGDIPASYKLANDGSQNINFDNSYHFVDVVSDNTPSSDQEDDIPVEGDSVDFKGNIILNFPEKGSNKSITIPYNINTEVNHQISDLLKNGNPSAVVPGNYINRTISNFNTANYSYDGRTASDTYDNIYVAPNDAVSGQPNVTSNGGGSYTYNNPDITFNFTANTVNEKINYTYGSKTEGSTTQSGANDTNASISDNTANAKVPAGWHITNNNSWTYGNEDTNSPQGIQNVNVAPNSASATINYVVSDANASNNGSTLATSTFSGNDYRAKDAGNNTFDINSTNDSATPTNATTAGIPAGYHVISDQNVPYDNESHVVKIIGNMHNQNKVDTNPSNAMSTNPSTLSKSDPNYVPASDVVTINSVEYIAGSNTPVGQVTRYIAISGRTGEQNQINPNDYLPAGYSTDSNDKSQSVRINPNSVSPNSIGFAYNAQTEDNITVTIQYKDNKGVEHTLATHSITGATSSHGNIYTYEDSNNSNKEDLAIPEGYHFMSAYGGAQGQTPEPHSVNGRNFPYIITPDAQDIIINVAGNPFNPMSNSKNPNSPLNPNNSDSPANSNNSDSPLNPNNEHHNDAKQKGNQWNPNSSDSPFNPNNSDSPYNPNNSDSPYNPNGPLSPKNKNANINPNDPSSPLNPNNPNSPIGPGTKHHKDATNPSSPWNPSNSDSPFNPKNKHSPYNKDNSHSPLSPKNKNNPSNPNSSSNSNNPNNPTNKNNPSTPTNQGRKTKKTPSGKTVSNNNLPSSNTSKPSDSSNVPSIGGKNGGSKTDGHATLPNGQQNPNYNPPVPSGSKGTATHKNGKNTTPNATDNNNDKPVDPVEAQNTFYVTINDFNGANSNNLVRSYQKRLVEEGNVGDSFSINPNDYITNGYSADSQDQSYTGQLGVNGLEDSNGNARNSIIWNYNANPQTAHITYKDQAGNTVTRTINGHTDSDVDVINSGATLPDGYHKDSNQNYSYQFATPLNDVNPSQTYTIQGDAINGTATINTIYQESNRHVDTKLAPTINLNGQQVGNHTTVSALNYYRDNYNIPKNDSGQIQTWQIPLQWSDVKNNYSSATNSIKNYNPSTTFTYIGQSAIANIHYVDISNGAVSDNKGMAIYNGQNKPIVGTQVLSDIGTVGSTVDLTPVGSRTGVAQLQAPAGFHFVSNDNNESLFKRKGMTMVHLSLTRPRMNLMLFMMPNKVQKTSTITVNFINNANYDVISKGINITKPVGTAFNVNDFKNNIPKGYTYASNDANITQFDQNNHTVDVFINQNQSKPSSASNNSNNSNSSNSLANSNVAPIISLIPQSASASTNSLSFVSNNSSVASQSSNINNNTSSKTQNTTGSKSNAPVITPSKIQKHNKGNNRRVIKVHTQIIPSLEKLQTMKVGKRGYYKGYKVQRVNMKHYYFQIMKNTWGHKDLKFTKHNRIKLFSHHTNRTYFIDRIFKINDQLRFEIKVGHHHIFISNQHHNMRKAYIQPRDIKGYKHIRVIRDAWIHRSHKYSRKNQVRFIRKGTILSIKRIKFIARHDMTRIQLTNGQWFTANKNYVKLVK